MNRNQNNSSAETIRLKIIGMDCPDCALKIEKGVASVDGIERVAVDFLNGTLTAVGKELSSSEIEKQVRDMGYKAVEADQSREQTTVFSIQEMDCADEERSIRLALKGESNVSELQFNLIKRELTVTHACPADNIVEKIRRAGFKAVPVNGRTAPDRVVPSWKVWSLAVSTILIVAGGVMSLYDLSIYLTRPLILAGIIIGGWHIGRKGLIAARRFRLDMNFLMSAAVIGALFIGEWSEAGAVVVLFALAQLLESYSLQRSRRAISRLMDLSPRYATVIRNGEKERVPVDNVKNGDIVFLKPGERIPVDGVITKGRSSIDQSSITGEAMPVSRNVSEDVFAGTFNIDGALEVRTTHAPGDTTLDRIIRLVEEAQTKRAPSQSFVDKFSTYYTPAVVGIALLLAIIPPIAFGAAWKDWIYRALALLVISCPCALVISTPISIVSALANAARNGVLIKGGVFLENAHRISAIAFDKTGTITKGKSMVTGVTAFDGSDPQKLIRLAASVESHSEHPLARAIVHHARANKIDIREPRNFKAIPGMGAYAEIDDEKIIVGRQALFEEMGILDGGNEEMARLTENESQTTVLVGSSKKILGMIAITDEIRPEAVRAAGEIRKEGIEHLALITGDNRNSADLIGKSMGADEIYSDLMPWEKVDIIQKLQSKYGDVAMVGDGVNDAPALASGTIGIAMGAAGSDSALETADIALMSDDLLKIPWLIRLSKKTHRIIIQNISLSIVVKIAFVALASLGLATLWMAVFADMGISLLVIFNGLRALRST
jgi:Cd2+/Zn2+-exporting ATPase